MKPTPHLVVAGILSLIALAGTASALIGGGGAWPVATRELRVVGPATSTDVVPAERALAPLVPELAESPTKNPFSARIGVVAPNISIPPPPPPRVEYPPLPSLPAAVR